MPFSASFVHNCKTMYCHFSGFPGCRNVLKVSVSACSDDNLTLGYLVPKLETKLAAVLCEAQAPNADKR